MTAQASGTDKLRSYLVLLATIGTIAFNWLAAAGLEPTMHKSLPPGRDGKIGVSLWLARDPRALIAANSNREVA